MSACRKDRLHIVSNHVIAFGPSSFRKDGGDVVTSRGAFPLHLSDGCLQFLTGERFALYVWTFCVQFLLGGSVLVSFFFAEGEGAYLSVVFSEGVCFCLVGRHGLSVVGQGFIGC